MPSRAERVNFDMYQTGEPGSSRRNDYLVGIVLLFVVVFLWTTSSFVTQALYVGGYHKPFLVTYLNTGSFAFYLLPFLIRYLRRKDDLYESLPTSETANLENSPLHTARAPYVPTDGATDNDATNMAELPPLTTKETIHLASAFCFFWFIANWTLNASLDYTSVASSTILSSTSGFFTLAIGRLFSVETLTPAKIAAVVTSFSGVILVALSDSNSSSPTTSNPRPVLSSLATAPRKPSYTNPFLGDSLALLASIFYALYVILLKIRMRSESRIDMQLFFGFVGLINILALLPVGVLLHFTGVEPFKLPSTGNEWGGVLVNMFITFSSDYIYVVAMLKTTPLLVTIGLSLTIPLAIVGDKILNKPTKMQAAFGALLVLGAFGLVGWENAGSRAQKQRQQQEDGSAEVDTS